MTTVKEIDLGEFTIGNVDRIKVSISKDDVAWNLSGGTVTFTFEKPDRITQFEVTASELDPTNGVFFYDTTINDLDQIGYWTLGVKVTDGAIVKKYPYEIFFRVVDEP
jgi:hypothetical protein